MATQDDSLPAQLRHLAKKWRERHENHAAGLMEQAADELDAAEAHECGYTDEDA